jgi:preprotein translocase subunit SecA
MRIFASDMVKNLMGTLGIKEDEPIQSGMVSRSLEGAQEKIEGVNFDSRKHVLGFDDVLNLQRTTIYARRRAVLMGDDATVLDSIREHLALYQVPEEVLERKLSELGAGTFVALARRLLLQAYDMFWIEHLETMDHLRNSVNLRSWGGRDPFIEYRKEGLKLFRTLETSLSRFVSEAVQRIASPTGQGIRPAVVVPLGAKVYERNDHVRVTDGTEVREMKYKKAEELLTQGWRIVE